MSEKKIMNITHLDLVKRDQDYIVYTGSSPLETANGREFVHSNDRLLKHIITGLQLCGGFPEQPVHAFYMLEFSKDYLEQGRDLLARDFDSIAAVDEFILVKTRGPHPGPPGQYLSLAMSDMSDPMSNVIFWGLSAVIQNLNNYLHGQFRHFEGKEEEDQAFVRLLKQEYGNASGEEKAAIHFLSYLHRSCFVLPFLFVRQIITASEYSKGVLAVRMKNEPVSDRYYDGDHGFPYKPEVLNIENAEPRQQVRRLGEDAMTVMDYLSFFRLPAGSYDNIPELIRKGESDQLEFKSTLRWDLKAGKTNAHVERASLKSLCAFLNTTGGTLLIGVRDDGSVEGIESDRFTNEDKFLLHLWTLVRTCLGRDISPYLQARLVKSSEKTICILNCTPSPRPVFLRQPGFDEEFFIRLGPSSTALDISEALKYIADRFGQK